jgi:hypothetical protein
MQQESPFPVVNGKVAGKILVAQKPARLIADPNLENMEIFTRDNEKAIPGDNLP